MRDKPISKLDQTRTEIESLLRQFKAWGQGNLQERKDELGRSIAESGSQVPALETVDVNAPDEETSA